MATDYIYICPNMSMRIMNGLTCFIDGVDTIWIDEIDTITHCIEMFMIINSIYIHVNNCNEMFLCL